MHLELRHEVVYKHLLSELQLLKFLNDGIAASCRSVTPLVDFARVLIDGRAVGLASHGVAIGVCCLVTHNDCCDSAIGAEKGENKS